MDKEPVKNLPINLSEEFCPHAIGNVLHNLSCKMAATGDDEVEDFAEEIAKAVKLLWQLPCLTAIQQIWRHCDSEAEIATLRGNDNRKLRAELETLRAERKAVLGTNEYGLDMGYMSGKLNILLRDIDRHTPDEAARVLARLAKVADESVLLESEFLQPSSAVAVHDVDEILVKLNHVLKMNQDVMTGTGVVYIEEVISMLSTPTPPKDERPDIVSTLKDLSVRMIDIGAEMEYTAGFNAEMAAHGRELVGAGMIASDWADKIKESEHE